MSLEYDHLLKILLIGDSGIGKSTFLLKYVDNAFTDSYISTIGVDFKVKEQIYGTKKYKLQIWDTAGQERFKAIISTYYRGVHYIIVMFDLTDLKSFENVKMWLGEITKHANENSLKILVGTKADLVNKTAVSNEMIQEFVNSVNMEYIATSAKNGTNINDVFEQICLNYSARFAINMEKNNKPLIQPQYKQNEPKKKNCCS